MTRGEMWVANILSTPSEEQNGTIAQKLDELYDQLDRGTNELNEARSTNEDLAVQLEKAIKHNEGLKQRVRTLITTIEGVLEMQKSF